MTAAAAAILLRASSRRAAATATAHRGGGAALSRNVSSALSTNHSSASRGGGQHRHRQHGRPRYYSSTSPSLSEASAATKSTSGDENDGDGAPPPPSPSLSPDEIRRAALRYNSVRARWRREVSQYRKRYALEYKRKKEAEEAAAAAERARLTRRRLERQRAKNTRSALNAIKGEGQRQERWRELEREYAEEQERRDLMNSRLTKARRMLLDELEEESKGWMTSPEEVEASLGNEEASQKLWARPGGTIGAADIGEDGNQYWRYECHHWDMSRTYKSPREMLLEELEEMDYAETNIDDSYWTKERIADWEGREEKAKLRSMVRQEGRRRLLQRQREMMQDARLREVQRSERELGFAMPLSMPVPHLGVLADVEAQEREGAKVLLEEDPGKFFRFEGDDDQHAVLDAVEGSELTSDGIAGGAADEFGVPDQTAQLLQRGRPTRLVDPLRDPNGGSPYPLVVGRLPDKDTRTDAQRRRDEREARMWEAARKAEEEEKRKELGAAAGGGEINKDIEAAADGTLDDGTELDYDEFANASDDFNKEWEEGLDPLNPEDAAALSTPPEYRYTEEDVDWVLNKLRIKGETLKEFHDMEMQTEEAMRREREAEKEEAALLEKISRESAAPSAPGVTDDSGDSDSDWAEGVHKTEGVDERGQKFVQYDLPDYTPGDASVDDLLDQLDAADKLDGKDLPDDPASILPTDKKPKPTKRARPTPTYDPELDRLARQLGLDDVLDELDEGDAARLDALLDSSPELSSDVESVLADFTEEELSKLNSLEMEDLGEDIVEAMNAMDAGGSETLSEERVAEALRRALPDIGEEKLDRLVRLEMELERDEGVRRAVLGEKKKKEKDSAAEVVNAEEEKEETIIAAPAEMEKEGSAEGFDVVDVDAAEAPTDEAEAEGDSETETAGAEEEEKDDGTKNEEDDDEKKP